MLASELLLDQLIDCQRQAIRYYLILTVGLVLLGIGVMAAAFSLSSTIIPEAFKSLVGIGGGFISSLSAFQIKEILARREKAKMFGSLKAHLDQVNQEQDTGDEDTHKRIDELVWKIVEKTALG